MSQKLKLAKVRLSFTHSVHSSIWEARKNDSGADTYGCILIIEKGSENHNKITAAMKAACKDAWGEKAQAEWKKLEAGAKLCLRDGAIKDGVPGFGDGVVFMTANSKTRPTLMDGNRKPTSQEDGLLVSGNYANAIVEIYALTKGAGAPRICCSLGGLMFASRGEALGGSAPAAASEFDDFEDGDNGLAGLGGGFEDDDAPF